jgi:hypothetical protein
MDLSKIEGTSGLFEEVTKLGIKTDHWQSDLYIPCTDQTTEILKRRGILGTVFVNRFTSIHPEDKGSQWYEVVFAYSPFWDNKS